jgi:HSP20 family protein
MTKGEVVSGPRTPLLRSTSFLVATGCPHGAVPNRVDLPIEHYDEGGRRFVRAYLPGADLDRDIGVTLRGSALSLRCDRRLEYPDCDRKAPHHVTFDKVVSVPAGTTPDDVAAEYGEGVLLVSWPKVSSTTRHTFPLTRCELPVE